MARKVLFGSILFIVAGALLFPLARIGHTAILVPFLAKAMLSTGAVGVLTSSVTLWILGQRRADRLFLNLTVSLITGIVFLVIGEFATRFILRDITTTADNGSYFARRWKRTVRKNSWGLRERNFDLQKPEGVYRIAVVGDSITYGQGIEEKYRFSNLLEKELNSKKLGYEVLNFGRPGAETLDHVRLLNDLVLQVNADFILLQWFTNDVEGHDKSGRPRPLRLIPSEFLVEELQAKSAVFHLVNDRWVRIQRSLGWLSSYDDYMLVRFRNRDSESSLAATAALREFIHRGRDGKVPLGIVLFSRSYFAGSPLDFLTERALELCRQEAVACLDLRGAFGSYREGTSLWANKLDPHPGGLAQHVVAERLMETFGELWLSR